MMKTKYLIGALLVALLAISCEDFLEEEPPNFVSTDVFWVSAENARIGTDAMYETLSDGSSNSVYGRWWPAVDVGTDDVMSRVNRNNFADWFSHTINAGHPWLEAWQTYDNHWTGIARANDVLEFVPRIAMDETEKNALLGEAYAFRAFCYFNLVRAWGDLPKVVNSIDDASDFNLPRSSADEIYTEIIIPGLQFAEENCVDELHNGRMTKWSAKLILADVYLTYAGTRRTSQGEFVQGDASYYALARDKAKEIIDGSPHALITEDFVDGEHITPACGVPWLEAQPYSVESILEFGSTNVSEFGSWLSRECSPFFHGRQYWGPAGGMPLVSEGNSGRVNNELRFPGRPPATGFYIPTPDLYAHFEDGDERRDWGIMTRYDTPDGNTYLCQPTFRKYVDIDFFLGAENTSFFNTNNNFIVYRYADALLIFAEAQNEADGSPNTEAILAVNEIRNRAGLSDLASGLSQNEFRDAVLRERRSEFHGEIKRKFDLMRTNRLLSETSDIKVEWTAEEGSLQDYTNKHVFFTGNEVWPDREWLYPIPQTQMNLNVNNNWVQNEGYGL
ncbi:MAG: RagB/SusD family nutrient uptake outer membrane protein [Bacteroidota bacterium]